MSANQPDYTKLYQRAIWQLIMHLGSAVTHLSKGNDSCVDIALDHVNTLSSSFSMLFHDSIFEDQLNELDQIMSDLRLSFLTTDRDSFRKQLDQVLVTLRSELKPEKQNVTANPAPLSLELPDEKLDTTSLPIPPKALPAVTPIMITALRYLDAHKTSSDSNIYRTPNTPAFRTLAALTRRRLIYCDVDNSFTLTHTGLSILDIDNNAIGD